MNIYNDIESILRVNIEELVAAGTVPEGVAATPFTVSPPRDPKHGDVATNVALASAKSVGANPRALAESIADRLGGVDMVDAAEVAGPGFINLRMGPAYWHDVLMRILAAGDDYGCSDIGAGQVVNVEFVSANPTGPMHVGHARGAVFGDVLASVLAHTGHDVTREYYINDAGAQVEGLAWSVYYRYLEALGANIDHPTIKALLPGGELTYPGEYLIPVGGALKAAKGDSLAQWGVDQWEALPPDAWMAEVRSFAVDAMMALIRDDLAALGITFDRFSSERRLVGDGRVDDVLAAFRSRDLVYDGILEPPKGKLPDDWEPREQTLFRATAFGDETDRPLMKSDGSWTYFATDIAYHLDKYQRGFKQMINVWGADHGGYVKRMRAAVAAASEGAASLDVKLCQMVRVTEGGEPVKMSKRAGNFVSLRDVVDAVGKDVTRFIMLTRRNDAPLDFDLAKVQEQSKDNPVFYVQYAHARTCSVLRQAPAALADLDCVGVGALAPLTHAEELGLIKLLAGWPRVVEQAAEAQEPHRLAFYLEELAAAFHGLWNMGNDDRSLRFIVDDEPDVTRARLVLIQGVRQVIACGLGLLGVTPVAEMR